MAERNELYQATYTHVEKSFSDHPGTVKHLRRTADWIEELKPDADEALMIAAVAHDIERSERTSPHANTGFREPEYLRHHQERGGEMVEQFLTEYGAPQGVAKRVRDLIAKHEVGGDDDQNLLKDADSVSFFENNIDNFLTKQVNVFGPNEVRDKFDWMFDRITDERARKIAKPFYEEAVRRLEEKTDKKTEVGLRPATNEDTDFARRVHHEAYRDVVTAQFGEWDEAKQDKFFESTWAKPGFEIITYDGQPVGYTRIEDLPSEIKAHELVLLPEAQGKGIGTSLLKQIQERAKDRSVPIKLQVLLSNRAQQLYERVGFKEIGRTDTHVEMMWRSGK